MIQLFLSVLVCANFSTQTEPVSILPVPYVQSTSNPSKTFTTGWEPAAEWNRKVDQTSNTSFYTHLRTLPSEAELGGNSLVLVFAKGYSMANVPEKPMGLPFTYFSSDNSAQGFNWYQSIQDRNVAIQLVVPSTLESSFETSKGSVQFRYFVLSPQFFKEKGMTPAQVRGLSYKKFVELLGTTE